MAAQYITGLQHIGIPTNDIEKTTAFYHELGFEAAGERVVFLRCGSLVIETYENHQAAERNGAVDHVALDVTDIEAVFAEIKEAGYPMLDEEIQFLPFWANGVRFFTILGPNREKVEFSQML